MSFLSTASFLVFFFLVGTNFPYIALVEFHINAPRIVACKSPTLLPDSNILPGLRWARVFLIFDHARLFVISSGMAPPRFFFLVVCPCRASMH